ncbi:C-type mannose receptor 2-like [Amphiura filiformis]|uniref:C-type mannose receptor 2-like n=1 Tax=Amphiura filiformis TaxID=82378 RepID=UPI003B21E725
MNTSTGSISSFIRITIVCFLLNQVQVYCGCPDDWITYDGHCYYLSTASSSFSAAKASCKSKGAELTSIHSDDENNFLLQQMEANRITVMWIGLHDITTEGNFEWIDGTPYNFTDWIHQSTGTSEPNSWRGGEEDCVDMKKGGPYDIASGSWNDEHCTGRFKYMCKADIPSPSCLVGWREFNNTCYWFQHDYVYYVSAKRECNLLDAQLAVIHSQEEQDFLAANVQVDPYDQQHYYHIGLHDTENEGRFQWVDGTPIDFTAWAPGEPNNVKNGNIDEDCAGLSPFRGGIWNDYPCTRLYSYICEKPLEITRITETDEPDVIDSSGDGPDIIDTSEEDGCQTTVTPDAYRYQYVWPAIPVGATSFTFSVRGTNDVHIALSPINGDAQTMYEIVIGGWANQNSAIRLCKQCTAQTYISTPGFLTATEYREFRVSFENDLVEVSRIGDAPFMSFQNTDSIDVKYVGISTGWGSEGSWKFCGDWSFEQVHNRCPDGWPTYDGHCYYVSTAIKSFSQATRLCKSMGAELTSIRGADENNFVLQQMPANGITTMWIGLHDITSEGNFEWIDGTPYNFTDWIHQSTGTSEPNSWRGVEEDCVDMKRGGSHDIASGSWNDEDCSGRFRYMCKTEIPTCLEGWKEFNNTCYLFEHNIDYVSYVNAKRKCDHLDAQLAVIHSQEEQDFLAGNIHVDPNDNWHYYYIGLHDTEIEGQFEWVDGTPLDFIAWNPGEPNNAAGHVGEDCVGLWPWRGGTWNDFPCSKLCSYICEKPLEFTGATDTVTRVPDESDTAETSGEEEEFATTTPSTFFLTQAFDESCPSDWAPYHGYCYFISPAEKSFTDAQKSCLSKDAELTSIHSTGENDFLLDQMGRNKLHTMWIGLHDTTREVDFEWVDGTRNNFFDWIHHFTGTSEPNSYGGVEDCGNMKRGQRHRIAWGSWNDANCCGYFPYACKKGVTSSCPNDIVTRAAPELSSTSVTWKEPFIRDYLNKTKRSRSHEPGQQFPIGATTVQYNFTDAIEHNLIASCTFTIVVNDTMPPAITGCPSDMVLNTELDTSGVIVSWIEPSASDFSKLVRSRTHIPGTVFSFGSTSVEYVFTDSYGNSAICGFTVTVDQVSLSASLTSSQHDNGRRGFVATIAILSIAVIALLVAWLATVLYFRKRNVNGDIQLKYLTEKDENI